MRRSVWSVVLVLAVVIVGGSPTTTTPSFAYGYDGARAHARVDPNVDGRRVIEGRRALGRDETSHPHLAAAAFASRGAGVATKTVGAVDDHIVLGLSAHGLEETAAKVGGRTLMSDPAWQGSLQRAIGDPSTRFTVSLDGLSGSSPYSQVMSGVQNGLTPLATPTNWELAQLYQAGRLADVNFVSGGKVVLNPFGG